MPDERRVRLIELLRLRSYERRRFKLASGLESDFFIDCKQTVLTAEGHALTGVLLFELLEQLPECEAVAGVELGGCPLASAVALVSHQKGRPLDALYVRKAAKDHGSAKLIEGDKSLHPGLKVALLEDVVTTGGSSLRAVQSLTDAGVKVVGIAALVDRCEGGAENIRGAGVPFVALISREEIVRESNSVPAQS